MYLNEGIRGGLCCNGQGSCNWLFFYANYVSIIKTKDTVTLLHRFWKHLLKSRKQSELKELFDCKFKLCIKEKSCWVPLGCSLRSDWLQPYVVRMKLHTFSFLLLQDCIIKYPVWIRYLSPNLPSSPEHRAIDYARRYAAECNAEQQQASPFT